MSELDSLVGQVVEIRRAQVACSEAVEIDAAMVVGDDEENVRTVRGIGWHWAAGRRPGEADVGLKILTDPGDFHRGESPVEEGSQRPPRPLFWPSR